MSDIATTLLEDLQEVTRLRAERDRVEAELALRTKRLLAEARRVQRAALRRTRGPKRQRRGRPILKDKRPYVVCDATTGEPIRRANNRLIAFARPRQTLSAAHYAHLAFVPLALRKRDERGQLGEIVEPSLRVA